MSDYLGIETWTITEPGRLDEIQIGDHQEDVRLRLGTYRVFRRTPESPESGQFIPNGLIVTYGSDRRVSLIELPSSLAVILAGVLLTGRELRNVVEDLPAENVVVDDEAPAIISIRDWRTKLYVPTGTVEGVSIGE